MTPADQQMDRVAARQASIRQDPSDGALRVIESLGVELERSADDLRCAMTQLADMGGRVRQIAQPLWTALLRDDLHELELREVIAAAVDALEDASGQPARALTQLVETRRAER